MKGISAGALREMYFIASISLKNVIITLIIPHHSLWKLFNTCGKLDLLQSRLKKIRNAVTVLNLLKLFV